MLIDERRLFERFEARFPGRFKGSNDEFGSKVLLRDASAQGIKILSPQRLQINQNVAIELQLPDSENLMPLTGKIMWAKPYETQVWDYGLKFPRIDLVHMARLYNLVVDYIPDRI